MIKILSLSAGMTFIAFGIVLGQGLLVRFARSIDLKASSIGSIIMSALQTPSLYFATILYACAILSYLYVSKLISFTALNISITGLVIIFTLCADIILFKQSLNWAHILGAILILAGLSFMMISTRANPAISGSI